MRNQMAIVLRYVGGAYAGVVRDYDGKTADQRVAERRERLIDAGLVLFGEQGYADTSIRAVLRQSGLRDRYFGESFADLDSLLAAVYARIVEDELALCHAAVVDTAGSASAAARAVLEVLTRSLEGDPGRARIKLREVVSAGPVSRVQRQQGIAQIAGLVAELLPDGSGWDRQLVALSIVSAGDELLRAWVDGVLTRARVVDMVMLLFDSVVDRMTRTIPEGTAS